MKLEASQRKLESTQRKLDLSTGNVTPTDLSISQKKVAMAQEKLTKSQMKLETFASSRMIDIRSQDKVGAVNEDFVESADDKESKEFVEMVE